MKRVKQILLGFLVVGTLIAYGGVLISPAYFKLSSGISILIPFFILVNLIFCLYFLYQRSFKALILGGLLVLGYPFMKVSFSLHRDGTDGDFSILNYNVMSFHYGDDSESIFQFLADSKADIICLQEFRAPDKNIRRLNPKRDRHIAFDKKNNNLIIVSKYRVLRNELLFETNHANNIQATDLLIAPGDTLRVYNIHLQSMGINTKELHDTEGIRKEYDQVKTKFLEGSAVRAQQISALFDHLEECPYPMILAGDFNDVPFSYNYFQFRKRFANAFEEAGAGFGFTYNGRLPFLRIDNQFFSSGLEIKSFQTLDHVSYSDHFPLLGVYTFSN